MNEIILREPMFAPRPRPPQAAGDGEPGRGQNSSAMTVLTPCSAQARSITSRGIA